MKKINRSRQRQDVALRATHFCALGIFSLNIASFQVSDGTQSPRQKFPVHLLLDFTQEFSAVGCVHITDIERKDDENQKFQIYCVVSKSTKTECLP